MQKKLLDDQPRRYTREEQDRLRALTTPRLVRPFVYLDWLSGAMPARTGIPLFLIFWATVALLSVTLLYGLIEGIQWTWIHTPSGILWFILGIILTLAIRIIIRDAAATEYRVRKSIQEKDSDPSLN